MEPEAGNKEVVRPYVGAFNRGDLARLRTLFAPDAVVYGVLGWGSVEDALPIWRELHDGLAMALTVEAILAEGDTVAVRCTERGRSNGSFGGQGPTGRACELTAMAWFVLEGGRILRRRGARGSASMSRQLGF